MKDNTEEAIFQLRRGIMRDSEKRYSEAIVHYQEGLQLLIDSKKCISDPVRKKQIDKEIEKYLSESEKLMQYIEIQKEQGKYHERKHIKENSFGNSYQKLFGHLLNEGVVEIKIHEPYVRTFGQCLNFLRFCELAVKSCKNLKKILLKTTKDDPSKETQEKWLEEICASLDDHKIKLVIEYSETLHDRLIVLNTGWYIQIGRGLDYFKGVESKKMSLGSFDMDLRRCLETNVDFFHNSTVKFS